MKQPNRAPSTRAERRKARLTLMDDDDVRRWRANVARGSVANADNYWRMLALFLERVGKTPNSLLELTDKELGDLLEDYVARYEEQSSSTRLVIAAVRSWLARFDRSVKRKITFGRRTSRPRVDRMHVPTQDELRAILNAADVRARAAISVIAFGGQRLEVLGDYTGTDGLVLGDLADIDFEAGRATFTKVPCRVNIRRTLSKKAHDYFTFLGPEAGTYISAYLNQRAEGGEALTVESPLIIPLQPRRSLGEKARGRRERLQEMGLEGEARRKREASQPFIRTPNVSALIKKPMTAAGMTNNPPYIWRSYFESHAEMAAGLPKDWREFLVGHTGDISAEYATHKRRPEAKIDAMREAYAKVLPLIETNHAATVTRVAELEQKLKALEATKPVVTMDDLRERTEVAEALAKAQVDAMSPGELEARAQVDALMEQMDDMKAQIAAFSERNAQSSPEGPVHTQRIVAEAELEGLLGEGWAIMAVLPSGKIAVKREA